MKVTGFTRLDKQYNGEQAQPKSGDLPAKAKEKICEAISVNCAYNAMITPSERPGEQPHQLGNKTECALLGFVTRLGGDYAAIRNKNPEEGLFKVRRHFKR